MFRFVEHSFHQVNASVINENSSFIILHSKNSHDDLVVGIVHHGCIEQGKIDACRFF